MPNVAVSQTHGSPSVNYAELCNYLTTHDKRSQPLLVLVLVRSGARTFLDRSRRASIAALQPCPLELPGAQPL